MNNIKHTLDLLTTIRQAHKESTIKYCKILEWIELLTINIDDYPNKTSKSLEEFKEILLSHLEELNTKESEVDIHITNIDLSKVKFRNYGVKMMLWAIFSSVITSSIMTLILYFFKII